MALKYRRIRGTRDSLPGESVKWQYVERLALEVAANYGFGELRTPVIEKTELFTRSIGDTTDVVQKEMYTFDKGRESITLRPEGTAGAVRAVLENSMLAEALPVKVSYLTSCYRHENPQAGRYREFHQFGVECFGSASPSADAEVIAVAADLLNRLGITEVALHINSIGCPACRPGYVEKLKAYYRQHEDKLCHVCRERLEKNPLRLLDCKNEECAVLAKEAPKSLDNLCGECAAHFQGLKERLEAVGIAYHINPMIVRGLDYYTKTVFEFITTKIGAQGAVGGGGRYDGLVEQMDGPPTPGLGFAMGLERLLMVMEETGCPFPDGKACDIYIGGMGEAENIKALALVSHLRQEGFAALCDTMGRSVKAQMKYADKMNAAYSCIIGSNELAGGSVQVKDMATGEAFPVALSSAALIDFLYDRMTAGLVGGGELSNMLGDLLGQQEQE